MTNMNKNGRQIFFYNSDYGWFASVAEELGKKDKSYEIRSAKPKIEQTTYYDEENLTQTRTKSLTIL